MSCRKALLVIIDAARREDTHAAFDRSLSPELASAARVNMISPSCWTVPVMGSVLTGLHPAEHGLGWPLMQARCSAPTIAAMCDDAGRSFLLLSANRIYAPPMIPLRADQIELPHRRRRKEVGLGRLLGILDYGGRAILRLVQQMAAADDLPDLLIVHLQEAHHPYLPPPTGLAPRERLRYALGHLRYYTSRQAQAWEFAAHAASDGWSDARKRYLQCLDYDVRITEGLIAAYQQAGLLDDSLIVVTADHGEHLGEHQLADHQASLHEELVRVPCAVMAPSMPPGAQITGQFQHTDLLATLCGFLQIPPVGYEPSHQPLDLLSPRTWAAGHEHAFIEWTAWGDGPLANLRRRNPSYDFAPLRRDLLGVRTRRWKYIRGSDGSRRLYDLQRNPGETRDASADNAAVVTELDARLEQWRDGMRGSRHPAADEEPGGALLEQRLRDLGYI
jgi:arylsulfatase A-like enzyme